jgi:hypothetical protein
MGVPVTYASCFDVAIGRDAALLSVCSPSGEIRDGKVQSVEVVRLVMSHEALRTLAKLLEVKCREASAMSSGEGREARTFSRPDKTDGPPRPGRTSH